MKECPYCEGRGTVTIQSFNQKDGIFESNPPVTIECVACDGKGELTAMHRAQFKFVNRIWCQCDNPSHQAVQWKEGTHPECPISHFRCGDCGKIQQVG